jgi:hypothetical protein
VLFRSVGYTQGEGSYVPYADLTEAEVVGWVQESLGKDKVETSLAEMIELLKNPVQETGLPWAS